MNDSLHEGSVIPLLVWAQQRGIGTVVLNPNFKLDGGPRISAEAHVVQAWDQVILELPAKHLAMVAHSYGGVCTCRLLSVRGEPVSLLWSLFCTLPVSSAPCFVLPSQCCSFLSGPFFCHFEDLEVERRGKSHQEWSGEVRNL